GRAARDGPASRYAGRRRLEVHVWLSSGDARMKGKRRGRFPLARGKGRTCVTRPHSAGSCARMVSVPTRTVGGPMRPPLPYEFMPRVPSFVVESDDIGEDKLMPNEFAYDRFGPLGENRSPHLRW